MSKQLGLSDSETAEIWKLRQAGQTLAQIGLAVGRPMSCVDYVVRRRGGVAPRPRKARAQSLRSDHREEISRGLCAGLSLRAIARIIDRAPSTVSREVKRNGGRNTYRALRAGQRARDQARRPKPDKLSTHEQLQKVVTDKLELEWAPQQIAGWLKYEFAGNRDMQVSHETIYRSLFIQARGSLKKELVSSLRTGRKIRKPKRSLRTTTPIPDLVSIRERPAEVEDRAIPGHWEGDLIVGTNSSHVLTLVERHTRFVMLARLTNKQTETVIKALTRLVLRLPKQLWLSVTWDRGTEMAQHKKFTVATDVQVYFCDPQSPWQRGSNENTNGLLRQYLPKKTDLSVHSQAMLDKIARRLNGRPRQTLGWKTPAQMMEQVLR
jgi:IS30 family transposase